MRDKYDFSKIFFIDIETVPQYQNYSEVPENFKKHWERKSKNLSKENETAEELYNRAGIYSEFGRIVCISIAFINNNSFRTTSFADEDEKKLLSDFSNLIDNPKFIDWRFCGHNIKEFDIPFICRRFLINKMPIPQIINFSGKKPWETPLIDTMELWKFGDMKNYTSLALLADLFGIPTPKDDIDGSQVADVFYNEKNIQRIAHYCEKDVHCAANLLLAFNGKDIII